MISVVIPSWNGRHLLEECLKSIDDQTFRDFEIIVVDNGSEDGTVEWLVGKKVRCVALSVNQGFCGGVNAGIKAAKGDCIVLLNNDTKVHQNWLAKLAESALTNPEYQIFASRVFISSKPDRIDTVGDGFTIAGFGYKIGWMQTGDSIPEEPMRVFGASGCAVMFRKIVFDKIGLFDERFFAFAEDIDICFRALLAGYRCITVPGALVFHDVRSTAATSNTLFWYHRNLIWLLYKNLPTPLIALYSPHILMHWLLVAFRSIIKGWFPVYAKALWAGFSGLSDFRSDRTRIQKDRQVCLKEIRDQIDANWILVHWRLSSLKRRIFS